MTFKLLELAAKAAGLEVFRGPLGSNQYDYNTLYRKNPKGDYYNGIEWDPLTNDGDAFRLAVKAELTVHHWADEICVCNMNGTINESIARVGDIYAATRRVIVQAAAEIGRRIE